jgi:hypothetical protein
MLNIENTILSLDILEKKFVCDLSKCKGACCVHGDSGAPLEQDEVQVLSDIFEAAKPFMRPEGIKAVEDQGASVIDSDGDYVTPLINGNECAYVVFENDMAKCAIENAYNAGAVSFLKPISCHLYPIRVTKYKEFDALNYHQWDICHSALKCGKKAGIEMYRFLEQPLTRKYGKDWYAHLQLAASEYKKQAPLR